MMDDMYMLEPSMNTAFPFLQSGTAEHDKHASLCDDSLTIHEMLNVYRRTWQNMQHVAWYVPCIAPAPAK